MRLSFRNELAERQDMSSKNYADQIQENDSALGEMESRKFENKNGIQFLAWNSNQIFS